MGSQHISFGSGGFGDDEANTIVPVTSDIINIVHSHFEQEEEESLNEAQQPENSHMSYIYGHEEICNTICLSIATNLICPIWMRMQRMAMLLPWEVLRRLAMFIRRLFLLSSNRIFILHFCFFKLVSLF